MELNIQRNPFNFGLWCCFNHNGKEYIADLCVLRYDYDNITECMIFAAKDGQVTSWSELYCRRGLAVTEENLTACVKEFVQGLQ